MTRNSYLSQVSSLVAKETALDAQLAELQKRLALYEQRQLELSKSLETGINTKLDVAKFKKSKLQKIIY